MKQWSYQSMSWIECLMKTRSSGLPGYTGYRFMMLRTWNWPSEKVCVSQHLTLHLSEPPKLKMYRSLETIELVQLSIVRSRTVLLLSRPKSTLTA